jgi:hypothetical protein
MNPRPYNILIPAQWLYWLSVAAIWWFEEHKDHGDSKTVLHAIEVAISCDDAAWNLHHDENGNLIKD